MENITESIDEYQIDDVEMSKENVSYKNNYIFNSNRKIKLIRKIFFDKMSL